MNIATVIFDLDGVIADTISALKANYLRILATFGAQGNDREFDYLNGKNLEEICHHLIATHGLATDRHVLAKLFQDSFTQLYDTVQLVPGTVSLLKALQQRQTTIVLATAAPRASVEPFLERQGIRSFFSRIVCGDDVTRAKPDPEIYQLAKGQLNSPAYVIEDSVNGVLAALAADCRPLHLNRELHRAQTPAGAIAVASLDEAGSYLLNLTAVWLSRDSALTFTLTSAAPLTADEQAIVDQLWARALIQQPHLFDGLIYGMQSWESKAGHIHLSLATIPYRRLLAQWQRIDLAMIWPIGVCAVVHDASGRFLIGQRSESVSEYPGMYELAPAGSLDARHQGRPDPIATLSSECAEELGLAEPMINSINLIGLAHDQYHDVVDLVYQIQLSAAAENQIRINGEYNALKWMGSDELAAVHTKLTPTTKLILKDWININAAPSTAPQKH